MTDARANCPDSGRLTDLALGQLTGRERADALEHLVGCAWCRDDVQRLVEAAELTLAATAEAEPPIGFESGVFDAIRREQRSGRPARRRLPATLAAVAAVAAAVVGFLVGARLDRVPDSPVREAVMLTESGRDVGRVWAYEADPSWLLVSVPAWTAWEDPGQSPRQYVLHAELTDGSEVNLGALTFRSDGSWATTTALEPGGIRAVSIVDDTGRVWCRGSF